MTTIISMKSVVALSAMLLLGTFGESAIGQQASPYKRGGREKIEAGVQTQASQYKRGEAAVQIQPAVPVTQPIRIEVGRDIAKSVEVKQVPGNEIKVLPPPATVIYTPTPVPVDTEQHAHPHTETPTPTTPAPAPKAKP
jgi:hypothetical protein